MSEPLSQEKPSNFLRYTLHTNGYLLGLIGIISMFGARPVAIFLGFNSPGFAILSGLILVAFSIFLVLISSPEIISHRLSFLAVLLNFCWAAACIALLYTDPFSLTLIGKWSMFIMAGTSGIFIVLHLYGIHGLVIVLLVLLPVFNGDYVKAKEKFIYCSENDSGLSTSEYSRDKRVMRPGTG